MNSDRYARAREIFHAVCDMNHVDRANVLDEMCKDDPELRSHVELLLDHDFLDHDIESDDSDSNDAFAESNLGIGPRILSSRHTHTETLSPLTAENERFLPGARIAGRFRIVCLLGSGGMGEVYRADDLKLGHAVALKFLPTELSTNAIGLEYFLNEARLARQIGHPNVCRVYDIGEDQGIHYISMEFVDGEDLESLIRRIGRLSNDKGIDIARQLCLGLSAAHAKGVLHRDLKPANVMIDGHGRVRITDFGLARLATDKDAVVLGTPAYMAPEQLAGGESTVASDIYSLGLVLCEVFTGTVLRSHATDASIGAAIPKTLSMVRDIDPTIQRLIVACVAHEAVRRPTSALSVAAALPGEGSLETALAVGDTPSTDMIAAVEQPKLGRVMSGASLLGIVIGMAIIAMLSNLSQKLVGFQTNRLIQLDKARETIHSFGYGDLVNDRSWGLEWNKDYFRDLQIDDEAALEWSNLTGTPPAAAMYWYRTSPTHLVSQQGHGPFAAMFVTRNDPPLVEPGMLSLSLSADGRLLQFVAVPDVIHPTVKTNSKALDDDWRVKLFAAAGIAPDVLEKEMQPVAAANRIAPPPVYADTWHEWQSKHLVVDAAAYNGRPVYFRVAPIAQDSPRTGLPILGIVFSITTLLIFLIALVAARRRWLDGSADKRGASIMFAFILVTSFFYWCLQAHHVASGEEVVMILKTLARAILRGVLICAAYLALEPYVRQLWPRSLVGWNLVLRGRFTDPTVGRDVLMGIAAGVVAQLVGSAGFVFGAPRQIVLLADPVLNIGSGPFDLQVIMGPLSALGQVCAELFLALVGGFVASSLLFFVFRVVLRRTWLAAIAFVLFYSFPSIVKADYHGAATVMIWAAMALFLFFRFGVLTVAVGWFAWRLLSWPVSFDYTAAHLEIGVVAHLSLLAIAIYAFVKSSTWSSAVEQT